MNNLAAFPTLSTRNAMLSVVATLILIALLTIVLASPQGDLRTPQVGPMRWQPDRVRLA